MHSQKTIFYTDAILIGVFLSASSVTFYAIAGNLIEYLRKIILQATNVLNPIASELDALNDHRQMVQLILEGGKYSMLVALPVCTIYFTAGSHFIDLWMGTEYAEMSGNILAIITLSVLITIPHMTFRSILFGVSKHHIISNLRILEAASNLLLSVILIYPYGIIGVALGTAIPHVLFMGIILVSANLNLNF